MNDIVGTSYNDSALALLTTRVLVATVLVLAGGPQVPVALESFEARPVEEGVLLQWSLAGELRGSTAGIDVQRAEAAPGPFERLTREPLAAGGTTYLDTASPRGRTSWYRLEIRGRDGLTTFGPVP